ncbi:MAG: CapA family protein [Burkholderiales bacterium]|nr:CapA family protein [Anaerolineae bacterium]
MKTLSGGRSVLFGLMFALLVFGGSTHAQSDELYTILWAGDTFVGDAAQEILASDGYDWPFDFVNVLLNDAYVDADYSIANAEGPITTQTEQYDPNQRWSYNAQPAYAQALADAGIDAVSLSNNHALDRGPEGLADTISYLSTAGVQTFGAGMNAAEAEAPFLIETPHGVIAVVALGNNWGPTRIATNDADHAGTIALSEESITRGYELAQAAGADWVVAYVHWGSNYTGISDGQRRAAALFAAAGYDLVIGHGPHVVQHVEIIEGMPVVYSLGNFVFTTPGRFTNDYPGLGLIAASRLNADGFHTLVFQCILTDNDLVNFQPRACATSLSERLYPALHPDVEVEYGYGVLRW